MLSKLSTYFVKDRKIFYNFGNKNFPKLQFFERKPPAYSTVELPNRDITSSRSRDDEWIKKIIYNEVIHIEKKIERIKRLNEKFMHNEKLYNSCEPPKVKPLFLQCMNDDNHKDVKTEDESNICVHFPYEAQKNVLIQKTTHDENEEIDCDNDVSESYQYDINVNKINKGRVEFENPESWQDEEVEKIYTSQYGTSDPNIPVSNVPCGGCGALLHCKDTAIPGFVPKEIFHDLTETDLRGITCQRCLFLQEYNIALGINVNPDEYPEILVQIRKKKALVILMVDLLDFPCSIWPDIMNVIGENKPLVVVGNKIDLIIQDPEMDFINHRKRCLINILEDFGMSSANIKHIALISAKTGYGVESLITKLHTLWGNEGDIYIVGCTNVGKSTLFNLLIQSDFCKSKATDVLQRATVSRWPGTTLNLLKFPILKPLGWRRVVRSQRLKVAGKQMEALKALETRVLRNSEIHRQTSLKGYIGKSFRKTGDSPDVIGLDPKDPEFLNSKWCYDTPGVIHKSQILNLFTTEELAKVMPRETIIPRNFKLVPGNALFIGGIARLDLISSLKFVWFTVFASADLPVTVTYIEDADLVYEKLLGTNMFSVPEGGKVRLKQWPKLKSKDITVNGTYQGVAAADIVLSSAGWIAITLDPARSCKLRAWTPEQRGIFVRDTPLIKYSSHYKGNKIRGTPAYYPSIEVVKDVEFVV